LDEIGDMPLELQSKILQVLEQHEFVRVGGIQTLKVDVRIICATNRNLERALETQAIRDDLYYRLNEITVHLPPLRERKTDVSLLIDYFLRKYDQMYNKSVKNLSGRSIKILQDYHWPGNVRQLENLIKQIVVREDEGVIPEILRLYAGPLPEESASSATQSKDKAYSLKKRISETVSREEKRLIGEVLTKTNWNRRKAAEILEISYRSLLYKIKEYSLGGE
jgi:two-component system response regulator AtoC